MQDFSHETVWPEILVEALELKASDCAVDCTAGGGGHTDRMLVAVGRAGKVIAVDCDELAINALKKRFQAPLQNGNLKLKKSRFAQLDRLLAEEGIMGQVAGLCADVGVSSPQLDLPERGFSFSQDGPLDMRMDPDSDRASAADLLASLTESELAKIFFEFGEEPKSRYVAAKIVATRKTRPLRTTAQLAQLVAEAIHYKEKSYKHPATKVFQALRIAVNNELEELDALLDVGFRALKSGGRMGIISFHSLEDRLVKRAFVSYAGRSPEARLPRDIPLTSIQAEALQNTRARIIKPFPRLASDAEARQNPRARSAKMRVIEKI